MMFTYKTRVKYVIFGIITIVVVDVFGLLTHLLETDYYTKFSYPLDVNIDEILVAIKNSKEPPIAPINEYNYRFKIKNSKKCKQDSDNAYDHVVILYVIKSALSHVKQREGIRKSWGWEGRFSDVAIRRVFMLGTSSDEGIQDSIDEEYARNKDIVQADFTDTYYNNTIKTMMGFKWVVENCPKAEFIMFADDDMYTSTKNLLKFLRNPFNRQIGFRRLRGYEDPSNEMHKMESIHRNSRQVLEIDAALSAFDGRLLAGYVFFSSPMRHKPSKWYVTLSEYPFSKYPPYVTAGAYVMSFPALLDMYITSMYTKHFKFDDVYLGIVAKKCGITPLHNENFYFWRKPYNIEGYANVIASHGFGDPEELCKIWEEQRSSGHA